MKWYAKYLDVYMHDPGMVSECIYEEIKTKIESKYISSNPLVSVIVIAYNEEKQLLACLWSLADTFAKYPMEIIGADNNSSDRTSEIFSKCGVNSYLAEGYQSAGTSRQCGLNHAKGKYCICIDADTIYPPTYIETMIKELEKAGVVCVSSLWNYVPDKKHSRISLWLYESIRNIHLSIQYIKRPELIVRGMVFAHDIGIAKKIGYRSEIIRGEDGSLALAMKQYGKIKFIKSSKATALTSCRSLDNNKSVLGSLLWRAKNYLGNASDYFTTKGKYVDGTKNLAKKSVSNKDKH